jgi:5-methyltetrahydrofolate--homocysteine methyltransferase
VQNKNFLDRIKKGGVLFDGALGTMLIARGLSLGRPPELWNLEQPSSVREVHTAYLEAGAEVIGTNTFGGSPGRLSSFGLGKDSGKINAAGVLLARSAVDEAGSGKGANEVGHPGPDSRVEREAPRFVAFSIGPTGKMLPPVGKAAPEEICDEFAAQLLDAGNAYDLLLIETMFDLREALIALATARKHVSVPVAVTLTFMKNPRGFFTIMGDAPAIALRKLETAGADVVGANCTIASAEMLGLARALRTITDLPLLCQPNAGQPRVAGGRPVYDQTAEEFANDALALYAAGVNAVGGCCGTTPRFIQEVAARLTQH